MGKLHVVAVVGLLGAMSSQVVANWEKDYIGTPTFRLMDDPELSSLDRSVNDRQRSYNQVKRVHEDKEKEVKLVGDQIQAQNAILKKIDEDQAAHSTEIQNLQNQITVQTELKRKSETETASLKTEIPQLQTEVDAKKQRLQKLFEKKTNAQSICNATPTEECKKEIADLDIKIDNVTKNITNDNEKIAKKKAKIEANDKLIVAANEKIDRALKRVANLKEVKQKLVEQKSRSEQEKVRLRGVLTQRSNELSRIAGDLANVDLALKQAQQRKHNYRQSLVDRVLKINREGAINGSDDGRYDGSDLAYRIGESEGRMQGERDGHYEGVRAGQRRDYTIGHEIGLKDGEESARVDGERNGRIDGTVKGNTQAASRVSADDATKAANASDASIIGQNQGVAAGRLRADRDGKATGERTGQAEAIKKNETQGLKEMTVGGQFAGTFARSIPRFPNGYKGNKFQPSKVFNRMVVRKAYEDGYRARYQDTIITSYGEQVGPVFDLNYNRSYDSNYDRAFQTKYPESQKDGYNDGHKLAYDRTYPGAYENSFEKYRTAFSQSPNTSAPEYKSTYASNYKSVYSTVYESIRFQSFSHHELLTYNKQIGPVTEQYRKSRYAEVESVYKNGAVLKYENSSVTDIGTKGVGVNDSVMMPNEDFVVSVKVSNYGEKEAVGAKVHLSNGAVVALPAIAAKSTVVVKGAVKGQLKESTIGKIETISSYVTFPLTLEKTIQGRYFKDAGTGVLNAYDAKNVKVEYPISLSGLALTSELEYQKENKMTLSLTNMSTKKIASSINVELSSSSPRTIKTTFTPVAVLDKAAKLDSASLLVDNIADVYETLAYDVTVSTNGVIIGRLPSKLRTMAKLPYAQARSNIAIVANGEESSKLLLDMANDLGGLGTVAVIDTSLGTTSEKVLTNGVVGQKLVVLPYGTTSALNILMTKSKMTSFIFAEENKDWSRIQGNLSALKNSKSIPFKFGTKGKTVQTVLTNKLLNKSLADSNVVLVADSSQVKELLPLASVLTKTNDELVTALSRITETEYFTPSEEAKLLVQGSMVRSLHENLRINELYLASGSTFSRDKDIANKVKEDASLLHNKVMKKVDTKAKKDTIGLFLFAYELYYVTSSATRVWKPLKEEFTTALTNRLFGALFIKAALKELKNSDDRIEDYNKSLYKKVAKVKGMNAPFDYEEYDPNPNTNN